MIYFVCLTVRYVVILNGKEAIHEALIKHSLDFSDRPAFYTNTFFNKREKGKVYLVLFYSHITY